MKKYYLIIVLGVTSCKKKATPEMIEKYENIIRQRELFNSYFSLAEYDKSLKEHDGNNGFYYNFLLIRKTNKADNCEVC